MYPSSMFFPFSQQKNIVHIIIIIFLFTNFHAAISCTDILFIAIIRNEQRNKENWNRNDISFGSFFALFFYSFFLFYD